MAKNIKRPIRFVARKNTDPVGTVTEWGAWRKGKKGIAKKTFPGTHAKKKTLTNKSTNTSPQRKILFTGLDKANFKMGDKMLKEVRPLAKKYGVKNITLIHGGRPNESKVDENIIELSKHTGIKAEADPLQYSKYPKNAAGIRTQQRIDDPDLIHFSFDSGGNLSLKDKYQSYWKNKYGEIGAETTGDFRKGKTGRILKFPRSTVKDNKVIGKNTRETSKFKSLLDEIEDDTNPERRASGVRYAKNLDKWTKENFNINMITEKNQGRIDYLESGGVMTRGEKGEPTLIRQQPSFKKEYKSIDDFEQNTYVEDTSDLGREGQSEYGGSGRLPTGFKGKNKGTLLTGPTVVSVKRTGGMTDAQIASKNPYPQSSMSQIAGSSEYEDYKGQKQEGGRKIEIKNSLKQLTDVTDITEEATGEDKAKSGKGIERHKTSHLIREQPIKDRVEIKRTLRRFAPIFTRLAEAEKTARSSTNIPRRVRNLKRVDKIIRKLAKRIPDRLAFDAAQPSDTSTPARSSTVQSSGLKNVPIPKKTKVEKVKATKAKIAKGPLGGRKAKGTGWWEGTRRRVTPVGKEAPQVQPQPVKLIGPDAKAKSGTGGRFLSPVHKKINQRSQVRTKNPQEAKLKPQPITKTKTIITDLTPNLKKVTSTAKPSKKVVTSTAKKVSSKLQKVFHKPTGTANVEDKHKKLNFTGKGIKFTRGLGAFSLFSSVLGLYRGRAEARKELGREPTMMETFNYHVLPKKVRMMMPKYQRKFTTVQDIQ